MDGPSMCCRPSFVIVMVMSLCLTWLHKEKLHITRSAGCPIKGRNMVGLNGKTQTRIVSELLHCSTACSTSHAAQHVHCMWSTSAQPLQQPKKRTRCNQCLAHLIKNQWHTVVYGGTCTQYPTDTIPRLVTNQVGRSCAWYDAHMICHIWGHRHSKTAAVLPTSLQWGEWGHVLTTYNYFISHGTALHDGQDIGKGWVIQAG